MKGSMRLLVISLSSALLISGCNTASDAPTAVKAASPTPAQPTPIVTKNPPAPDFFESSGPIVVEHQVDIAAQREGIIARILVDTGAVVSKGQLLAELDNRQLLADLQAATAKMKSIEADVKNWEAEAQVRAIDLNRSEEMMKASLITQQQLEHDRYTLTATKYEVDRERENFRQQQAVVESLQLELEKTRFAAPFSGVVARRYIREGQRVAIGDRIFWVSETAPMRVKFTLPERFVGRVKTGEKLTVYAQDSPATVYSSRILQVSPVVDPASATIEVLTEIAGKPADLHPGMTAVVRVPNVK